MAKQLTIIMLAIISVATAYSYDQIHLSKTNVYIIGDFNDWQIPVDSRDNKGAISFYDVEYVEISYPVYSGFHSVKATEMFPKGDTRFVLYVPNGDLKGFYHDETFNDIMGDKDYICPIYLTTDPDKIVVESNPRSHATVKRDKLNKNRAFELKDWNGGIITFSYGYGSNSINKLNTSTLNSTEVECPNQLYSSYTVDGGQTEFVELNNVSSIYYPTTLSGSFRLPTLTGKLFNFSFTDDSDSNLDNGKTYGALYPDPVVISHDMDFRLPVVEGGYPFDIRLESEGDLKVTIHPVTKHLSCSVLNMPADIENINADDTCIRYVDNHVKLNQPADVRIYDICGNLILNCFDNSIDLSHIPTGIYIVKSGTNTLKIKI